MKNPPRRRRLQSALPTPPPPVRHLRRILVVALVLLLATFGRGQPGPSSIIVISGDNQTGASGQILSTPMGVQVLDETGAPVPGALVQYSVDPVNGGFLVENPADGTITTYAGGGNYGDGGPAVNASLSSIQALAAFDGGFQFACAADGGLFISDTGHRRIRYVDASGIISTQAGNGQLGPIVDGQPATETPIGTPAGLACDGAGNHYFIDTSSRTVRKIDALTKIVTTLKTFTSNDKVTGVTSDAAGNLYVTIIHAGGTAEGMIVKLAAGGGESNELTGLGQVFGITFDAFGDLFVVETQRVLRTTPGSGTYSVVAGTGVVGFSGDGGPAVSAQLRNPVGLVFGPSGCLYIADNGNYRVRRVDLVGIITTVAGTGSQAFTGDGGLATDASLPGPVSVAVDPSENLFIGTITDGRVRRIDGASQIISTFAGNGTAKFAGDGLAPENANLNLPHDVAVDSQSTVYIADSSNGRIRRVLGGVVSTVVGDGTQTLADGLSGTDIAPFTVFNVAVDKDDRVLFTDDSRRIFRWDPATLLVNLVHEAFPPLNLPMAVMDIAASPTGDLYYTLRDGTGAAATRVRRVDPSGTVTTAFTFGPKNALLAVDRGGNVIVLKNDTNDGAGLVRYSPYDGSVATIANVAGIAVTTDRFGHVYYTTDTQVKYVDRATGIVTHVAGTNARGFSGDGGAAATAQVASPGGLALDDKGRLLIADWGNDRIRRIEFNLHKVSQVSSIADIYGFAFSPLFQMGYVDPPPFNVTASVAGTGLSTTFNVAFSASPGGDPAPPNANQSRRVATNDEYHKFPRWTPMVSLIRTHELGAPPSGPPDPGLSHRKIAVDSQNIVHIVIQAADPELASPNPGVWYFCNRWELRRANGFSAGFDVSGGFGGDHANVAVRSTDDLVFVVWQGESGILMRSFSQDPAAPGWSPITSVEINSGSFQQAGDVVVYERPHLVADPAGGIHLVYEKDQYTVAQTSPDVFEVVNQKTSVVYRKNFGPQQIVDPDASSYAYGSVAVDVGAGPDSIAQVVYAKETPDGPIQRYAKLSSPIGFQNLNFTVGDLAVDGQDVPHFVSQTQTGAIVYHKGTAGAAIGVAQSGSTPLIVVEDNGTPHVLWGVQEGPTTIPAQNPISGAPAYATLRNGAGAFDTQNPIRENLSNTLSRRVFGFPQHVAISRTGTVHFLVRPPPIAGTSGIDRFYCRMLERNLGEQDGSLMFGMGPNLSANVGNGNLTGSFPVFSSRGVGFSTNLSLVYNSQSPDRGVVSPGWQTNYHLTITEHAGTAAPYLTLQLGDGRSVVFEQRVSGSLYVADPEDHYFGKILRSPTSLLQPPEGYLLTTKFGVKYAFRADGKLEKIEDTQPTKNTMTFTYGGNPASSIGEKLYGLEAPGVQVETVLSGIQDSADARAPTTFPVYGPRNEIREIHDPTGKAYTLQYTADGRLEKLRFPQAPENGALIDIVWSFKHSTANIGTSSGTVTAGEAPLGFERFGFLREVKTPRGTAEGQFWRLYHHADNRTAGAFDPKETHAMEVEGSAGVEPFAETLAAGCVVAYFDSVPGTTSTSGPTAYVTNRRNYTTQVQYEPRRCYARKILDAQNGPDHPIVRQYENNAGTPMGFRNLEFFTDRGSKKEGGGVSANTTTYAYAAGAPIEAGDPAIVFDNLESIVRPGVPAVAYTYTSTLNRVKTVTDAKGAVTTYDYDGAGDLTSITYPNTGAGVRVAFDFATGAHSESPQTGAAFETFVYDARGRVKVHTDPNTGSTLFDYLDFQTGLVTQIKRPDHVNPEVFAYDAVGNTTGHARPGGGLTTYELDALYRVFHQHEPAVMIDGAPVIPTTTFAYDRDSAVKIVVDAGGFSTQTFYDKLGRLTSTTNAAGKTMSYSYDREGNTRAVKDFGGDISHTTYDDLNRTLKDKRPGPPNTETVMAYDPNGNVDTVTESGAVNRVTSHFYDGRNNNVLTVQSLANFSDGRSYDFNDNMESSQHFDGAAFMSGSHSSFDARNRVVVSTQLLSAFTPGGTASGTHTNFFYDHASNRSKVVDHDGKFSLSATDLSGRSTAAVDGSGVVVSATAYNDDDLAVDSFVKPPAGTSGTGPGGMLKTSHRIYSAGGELIESQDALGLSVKSEYDIRGLLVRAFDQDNGKTEYDYDALGRMTETRQFVNSDGLGVLVTKYEYDDNGNRTMITDPRGKQYKFYFDNANRMILMTTPLGFGESWTYTDHGELFTHQDANGKVATMTYDGVGRLTRQKHQLGGATVADVWRIYDGSSNLKRVVDLVTGVAVDGEYTKKNELEKTTWRLSATDNLPDGQLFREIAYTYFGSGSRKTMAGPDSDLTEYDYDLASRLETVKRNGALAVRYVYDGAGRRQEVQLHDSGTLTATVSYAYTVREELYTLEAQSAAGQQLAFYQYHYDDRGNRDSMQVGHLGTSASFGYLPVVNWLTSETWTGGTAYTQSQTYDENGNRKTHLKNGKFCDYNYDDDNRLLSQLSQLVVGGSVEQLPGTPLVDSTQNGFDPARVTDGVTVDNSSSVYAWRSKATISQHFAGVTLAAPASADRVKFYLPTLFVNGSANVAGSMTGSAAAIPLPSIAAKVAAAQTTNDNASILTGGATNPIKPGPSLVLKGNDVLTLNTGTYFFTKVDVKDNAKLQIAGNVRILMTGDMTVRDQAVVNAAGPAAKLIVVSTTIGQHQIRGTAQLRGLLYSPSGSVVIRDSAQVYGAAIANEVKVTEQAKVHYVDGVSAFGAYLTGVASPPAPFLAFAVFGASLVEIKNSAVIDRYDETSQTFGFGGHVYAGPTLTIKDSSFVNGNVTTTGSVPGNASNAGLARFKFQALVGATWTDLTPLTLSGAAPNPSAPGWLQTATPAPHLVEATFAPTTAGAFRVLMDQGGGSAGTPDVLWANEIQVFTTTLIVQTQTIGYGYDSNGNQISRSESLNGVLEQLETFAYDYANGMNSYLKQSGAGATLAHHSYLAAPTRQRLAKSNNLTGASEWYMYDGADSCADYSMSGGTFSVATSTYVQGLGIDSKWVRIDGNGQPHFYLPDGLGSVARVINAAGVVENTELTTAWGEPLISIQGLPDRHGFTQRERDPESSLMYYRARMYDVRTGRFGQRDPVSPALEHYVYGGNNPLSTVDPLGLEFTFNFDGSGRPISAKWIDRGSGRPTGADVLGALPNRSDPYYQDYVQAVNDAYTDAHVSWYQWGWFGGPTVVSAQVDFDRILEADVQAYNARQQEKLAAGLQKAIVGSGRLVAELPLWAYDVGAGVTELATGETTRTYSLQSEEIDMLRAAGQSWGRVRWEMTKRAGVFVLTAGALAVLGSFGGAFSPAWEGAPGAGLRNFQCPHVYARPRGATTAAQRAAVQGKPCIDCGVASSKMVADHILPLVKEYYYTGRIDVARMRSLRAVQPQCSTCSARQGAELRRWSKGMYETYGNE